MMLASWMSFEKPGANVIGCRLQSILAGNTFRPTLCDLTTFLRRVVSLASRSALHADRRIPDGHGARPVSLRRGCRGASYTPSRLPNMDVPPEQKSMIAVRTRFHHLVDTDEAHTGRCGRQSRRC
jgi:hypothetical protein